jgi:YHYH protein
MQKTILCLLLVLPALIKAQTPEITSWKINTSGQTGYAGILTNVQQVQYSNNNVYVSATCIPDYTIGPWTNNPNAPVNQNFVFKITRNPVQNTGTLVNTPMGHTGVWSNGVSVFNAKDGMSYNNLGVWNRDAYIFEGISFDNCLGHPAPNGEYHNHVNPTCLYDDTDNTVHAPIIGYAFDGFPIYGAYGFDNPNGTGIFRKMQTSYQLRNITSRTTLPDGTVLNTNQYGPAIGGQYPLGAFLEDYEYVAGSGDLDEHNGRFCVTPDYPNGIYAYFVTIDVNENPVYPYVIGPEYYGTVQPGNTGPNGGHNIVNEPVITYVPGTTVVEIIQQQKELILYSSNGSGVCAFAFDNAQNLLYDASLFDMSGKKVAFMEDLSPGVKYDLNDSGLPHGIYLLQVSNGKVIITGKIIF